MNIFQFPYVLYRFDKSTSDDFFEIKSSDKTIISNQTYLSTNLGSGGHIVGFFSYDPQKERNESLKEYTTLNNALGTFNPTGKKDLIVLDPWNLIDLAWNKDMIDATNTTLSDIILPKEGKLKFAFLGRLMNVDVGSRTGIGTGVGNDAEVDFIGDIKIKAHVFKHGLKYKKMLEELDNIYEKLYYREIPFVFGRMNISNLNFDKDEQQHYGGKRKKQLK